MTLTVGIRRTLVAAVAAATVLTGLTRPASPAAPQPRTTGLYGAADPTYDGVYRQSLAMLGLAANDMRPAGRGHHLAARPAVRRRVLPGLPRRPGQAVRQAPDPVNFTGPDTNSTATALMALMALDDSRVPVPAPPCRRSSTPLRRRAPGCAATRTPTAAGRTTPAARPTRTRPGCRWPAS